MDAKDYIAHLPQTGEYVEVGQGSPQMGDVVVWEHFGRKRSTKGYKFGHVGIVVLGADGEAYYVSNFNGKIQIRRLDEGGPRHFFRLKRAI